MADNALVTPQAFSLPSAMRERTHDSSQTQQQAIPVTVVAVSGELVTVQASIKSNFTIPQITIPQAFSQWIRQPTQVGDEGWAIPCDYYLGGQSGVGGGVANTYDRGNLTNLVFHHTSQKTFPANTGRNPNAAFINGPQGVVLQDTAGNCTFTLTSTGIVIKIGGTTLTINGSGLSVSGGDIVNNSLSVGSTHVHGGVSVGGANTGVPNP